MFDGAGRFYLDVRHDPRESAPSCVK